MTSKTTKISNYVLGKLKDPKFYLENFTKIKTKRQGKLEPFILNEVQKDLFNTMRTCNRTMILKARQLGASTGVVGFYYHNTVTTPGTTTALIGYNASLTSELLEKIKTFYKTTPDELKPTIQYNSRHEISFPSIDSKILVLPSTSNVGRGYTLNNVLSTELSSWEEAEEKMMTLEASVPIFGNMTIESTPRGQGNLFHKMWMSDDNGYAKKEYGWWWGYSKEEIDVIKQRMNNPMMFAQEYDLSFLASGRSVFDQEIIKKQRKQVLNLGDTTILPSGKEWVVCSDDSLIMYSPPKEGHYYSIGVDSSEGVEGGDYSSVTILDRTTGEEAAHFHGFLPPDILGLKTDKWGRKYNNGLVVVEINNHGIATLNVLKQRAYPTLYFRPAKFETFAAKNSDKLGWRTTRMTREILIDDYAQAIRDDELTIHSKQLLDEMSIMIYDNSGVATAPSSYHDDTVFSAALAVQGFKSICTKPLDQLDYNKYLPISFGY